MKAAGVNNALCINQEVGNAGLDARCKGFADGLGRATSTVVQVDLKDPTGAQQAIAAAIQADADHRRRHGARPDRLRADARRDEAAQPRQQDQARARSTSRRTS